VNAQIANSAIFTDFQFNDFITSSPTFCVSLVGILGAFVLEGYAELAERLRSLANRTRAIANA